MPSGWPCPAVGQGHRIFRRFPSRLEIDRAVNDAHVAVQRDALQLRRVQWSITHGHGRGVVRGLNGDNIVENRMRERNRLQLRAGKDPGHFAPHRLIEGGKAQAVVDEERAVALQETAQGGDRVVAEMEIVQAGQIEKGEIGKIVLAGIDHLALEIDPQRRRRAQLREQRGGAVGMDVERALMLDLRENEFVRRRFLVHGGEQLGLRFLHPHAIVADGVGDQIQADAVGGGGIVIGGLLISGTAWSSHPQPRPYFDISTPMREPT